MKTPWWEKGRWVFSFLSEGSRVTSQQKKKKIVEAQVKVKGKKVHQEDDE